MMCSHHHCSLSPGHISDTFVSKMVRGSSCNGDDFSDGYTPVAGAILDMFAGNWGQV